MSQEEKLQEEEIKNKEQESQDQENQEVVKEETIQEENKVALVLDNTKSLREYEESDLTKALIYHFMPWVSRLLSLTGETSADRLEVALPAIRTQCIGMGFPEVKKMFEMYVDGKLKIEPRANYFDRILLGNIVSSYKRYKNQSKSFSVVESNISEEENDKALNNMLTEAIFKYQSDRTIDNVKIYDYLHKKGSLPYHDSKFKNNIKKKALKRLYKKKGSKPDVLIQAKRNAILKIAYKNKLTEKETIELLKKNSLMNLSKEDYQIKKTLKQIITGQENLAYECKRIVLEQYLNSLIYSKV